MLNTTTDPCLSKVSQVSPFNLYFPHSLPGSPGKYDVMAWLTGLLSLYWLSDWFVSLTLTGGRLCHNLHITGLHNVKQTNKHCWLVSCCSSVGGKQGFHFNQMSFQSKSQTMVVDWVKLNFPNLCDDWCFPNLRMSEINRNQRLLRLMTRW